MKDQRSLNTPQTAKLWDADVSPADLHAAAEQIVREGRNLWNLDGRRALALQLVSHENTGADTLELVLSDTMVMRDNVVLAIEIAAHPHLPNDLRTDLVLRLVKGRSDIDAARLVARARAGAERGRELRQGTAA